MSQPTLNALNNTQNYLNQFKKLDKDNLGYLNVAQVKDYFKSQQLPQDDLIELASRTNQGRLTPEQFASAMNLSQMKNHDDIGYHSSKLSSLLRHCEESMKLFEQDKRMNVQSSDSKDKLLEAFKVLEDFMKQFIKSLDDTPSNNDAGPNRSTVPSTFEKMPGTYDFDAASSDMTSRQQSMTSPATTPVFLKNPSFRDIPESPNARHNEKEPALEPPSPLPQMNDAAFMSGLKPISGKNLNGDDAKPNNAHESDTYRSNVLDSLRNAAMDDAEIDDNHSKEREILFEDESHERAVPTASTRGITSNTNNALEYGGVNNSKPDAIIPRSSNKQSSDTNTKVEPQPATSSPSDVDAEKAIAPLAASVATVAAATATAAIALSDIDKGDSHPASPLETATDETHAPETFHGDLGHNGTEPFIEDAEDTELKPELQPSSAKWNKLNTNDAESSDYMDTAIADARSLSPKSSDFNQFENKKPFQRETFQGGLGGNGTEPYIKNEKDALLKPEDQPSFGAKQERLKYANDEKIESNDMEQPNVSKASTNKDSPYASEFFQGGLGGNGTEAYIKNEKDTWSRSEDKPSFDAEQKQPRKLNGFDTENEEVGALKDTDQEVGSSPSLGSTLSKIGAGAAGVAGAAALGLSEHNDNEKDKDRSIDLAPSNDASEHSLTSPRNAYSPSLTSGNSLENANHADVISDEALSDIADKVNEDIKHNDLKDNSATIDKDGVVSSDASDKVADNLDAALKENAVPTSTSLDVSPQKDINVLVDRDTSLPPNIDNEVDIETTNNGSNRSPLAGETTTPPTVLDSNDNANVTPSLNSAYTGSSSANPDSVYRAAPALDNDKPGFESHIPAAPAVSTPNISSTSRSLNPNDEIKDDYPRESPNDDANNKEDNPGFFKRLLKSRSRSPEPTSRSISAISDKAISKDSASPTAESRDSSKSADAPIVAKVDVPQGNAPSVALNTTGNLAGSDNALEGISPDVHDAGASLNTPEINASAPSAIFSSNIETPAVDFSNAGSKLDNSLDTHSSDNGIKSPGFNANVNMDASGLSNSLRNMSADIKGLKDNASGKFDGSVDSPTVGGNLPSTSFPNVDRKLDGSLEAPDIDAKLPSINSDLKSPSFNTDISVDRPDLSGSLPKISSGFRSFKDDVDDKFNGSIDTPDIDGKLLSLNAKLSGVDGGIPISDSDMTAPKLDMPAFDGKLTGYIDPPSADGNLPSVDTDLKSPDVDLPDVGAKLDRSVISPEIESDIKSPDLNANVNMNTTGLSSSLGKLSAGLKDLKSDISGNFESSVDSPHTEGTLPTFDANVKDLKDNISGKLNVDTPSIDNGFPSLAADFERPNVDLPDVDGKFPSVDAGMKGRNANLPDIGGKLPSLDPDLKTPKLEKPSLDVKLDSTLNTPDVDGKLQSLDTDIKSPKVDLPDLRDNLEGSISTPEIDAKLPSVDRDLNTSDANVDANLDASRPTLSGFGKLSSNFQGLKDDISGKFSGSVDTPDIDGKSPSLSAKLSGVDGGIPISDSDMTAPKLDMPAFDGKLTGYIDPPSADGNLPSVDTDLKSPSVDLPNVSSKLDRSISAPDVNDDLKSPDVGATIDRPDLSSSLGKLSSSFKGLKDEISGKFTGSVDNPDADGRSPSLSAKLSGVDGGIPISDSDMTAPKLDMPAFDGKLTGYIDPPSADGNIPSVNTDLKSPSADLPNISGKLDRSISAPDIDSNMKISGFNANSNVDTSGVSASLDKLSAGLTDIKDDIPSKFDDSVQSNNIDSELPTVGTNLKGSSMETPNAAGKLDDSIQEPDFGGKLSSLDTDLKGSNIDVSHGKYDDFLNADLQSTETNLPNISGNLDKSIDTPEIDTTLPSVDGKLESPKVDADANADAGSSSLSGALGKLSSGFKGLKDEITGVFSGSADASKVDNELPSANTDYCSPKFGLPDADLELDGSVDTPNISSDLPFADGELNTPGPSLSGGNINLNSSINTPGMNAKLPHLDTNLDEGDSGNLPSISGSRGFDSSVAAPKADVDVPDMHTPNLDASADGNISTAFVAPPRKIELSGSLGEVNAGLTTPKTDVDVPQVAADNDSPVAPPRSPRLSLNKLSSKTNLDSSVKSSNMDVDVPETSSGFKSPSFNVPVNGEPALESDLSTGLHRNASADASGSGSISADKADGEGPSSFFSKPIEKINGAVGNYDDQISETDETHDRKTSTGYATLRTRSRNESPDNLSAMLDDIVKRRFSNTPSETDVSSVISDKKANKKESASHKSTNLDASASLNTGVSEPHASLGGDKPRSTVSDSRFKELPEQEGEVTEYSTPITSPVLTKAAPSAAVTAPSVTLDKIDGLESDVEKQLDAMSVSVSEAPQVPAHEEDSLPSPSRTHRSSISLQSTSFHDRSAADAIKSVYDNMTSKLMTGGPKSGNGTDDRVLKVRDGFENFNGFGVKCVSDNEDEEKHTAPSSALK
ncbi:Neuroblast differentiation-associated protein [Mucor circinelloides]